ncbi:MAG: AI-2E family transporter [Verrucomicrobiales bacterium]|jgi:predicted PurR-regulated permease PerM|nr:AI-2E family transporter [Verrucomicrobiales bacterium]
MNGPNPRQERILWQALSALALLVLVLIGLLVFGVILYALRLFSGVLLPLAVAGVLACLLSPLVERLRRWRIRRSVAVIGLFVLATSLLLALGLLVLPAAYAEAVQLTDSLPDLVDRLRQAAEEFLRNHPGLTPHLQQLAEQLKQRLPEYGGRALQYAWSGVVGAFGLTQLFLGLVMIPLYVYYFLLEQAVIARRWRSYVPLRDSALRDEVVLMLGEVNRHLIAFFRGQVIVAGCIGLLTGLGLLLIGLKYAVLLGLVAGVLSMVPYLGVVASLVPALLVAYAQSNGHWGYVALTAGVFGLVQLVEGMFISPKIMGQRTGLHPLTVIVSILVWSILLGGLLGAILAVPLTATLKVLLHRYIWRWNA